jgi:lambda family phage portal protein
MGLLDRIAASLGYVRPRARSVGFAGADLSRLTSSLKSESDFINTVLRYELRILRARSRQATQNNPFARRFAQMVVDNVAGPMPFRLQAKIRNRGGKYDENANTRIEDAWKAWGRKGECEITGRWSWNTFQRLLIRTLAVDGELIFRVYRGPEFGPYGYQLQQIDIDRLWEHNNKALPDGGAIHMGVEVDPAARPVAYHLLKRKPAQWQMSGYMQDFERVPAEDIVHIFVPESAEQIRGVPWMYAAMMNLIHLGAFEEAAVIAARVGAAQMGVIQSPDGGKTLADASTKDEPSGNPQFSVEPGLFQMLPPGYEIQGWNPKYPDAAVEPFIKAMLRGVSSGLGVAYHNLANDMEGVNYSSARVAELDERDAWMALQTFVAEHLCEPIYLDWLRMSTLTGALPFELARLEKYRDVKWQGRRWAWVDPLKEVGASIEAINAKIKSRTGVISDGGDDVEEVFAEIRQEGQLAEEMDIDLAPVQPKAGGTIPDDQGGDQTPASGTESSPTTGKNLKEIRMLRQTRDDQGEQRREDHRKLAPDARLASLRGTRVERTFTIDREAGIDKEARTAWLSIASDRPYERWWGIEILDMALSSIRDERLKQGAALLVDHDTSDQVGVVENFEITPTGSSGSSRASAEARAPRRSGRTCSTGSAAMRAWAT